MSLDRFRCEVVCVHRTDSVRFAARRMRDTNVGAVVVLDDALPFGVLTDRDVTLRVVAEGLDPDETCVEDVLSAPVVVIGVEQSVRDATRLMRDHGVRRLPIVATSGALVGIVTWDDLALFLAEELSDAAAGISASAGG